MSSIRGLWIWIAAAALAAARLTASSGEPDLPYDLGKPPRLEDRDPDIRGGARSRAAVAAAAIDNDDREAVATLFQTEYRGSENQNANWTGNIATCNAGTTSANYREAVRRRINFYRTMADLPEITFDATLNAKDQETALMMIAEGALSHDPDPTWACYTEEGAEGAAKSNLVIGAHGPQAIDLLMDDTGVPSLGHRRWFLFPPQQTMGTGNTTGRNGDFTGSNATWVLAPFGPRPETPEFVAWPPEGFVPYQVAFPQWSFSYPDADFSDAQVTMTKSGQPLPVTTGRPESGFGDDTIVWVPEGFTVEQPARDTRYRVVLEDVLVNGVFRDFNYVVTVFDPDTASEEPTPTRPPDGTPTATPTRGPLFCGGREVTIAGTGGADPLDGTASGDVIHGRGGSDVIRGLGGNDTICGGGGGDTIRGGGGDDRILGGGGDDEVSGDSGNDQLVGGPGNDTLRGNAGNDRLNGGGGANTLSGGTGRDRCSDGTSVTTCE